MNDKQLLTRFLEGLAFRFTIALLLCSTAIAQQLTPNPNPLWNTIIVPVSADNFQDFDNLGTIQNLGTIYNWLVIDSTGTIHNLGTIENLGTIDNSGLIWSWFVINNSDIIDNTGIIINEFGSTIGNFDTIDN